MALARLTSENLPLFVSRLEKLTPDTPPKWGSLSSTRLLTHLRLLIEMSLEETAFQDRSTWFSRNVMRVLAFHVMPSWPKGKIKAPTEFTPESPSEFEEERAKCVAAFGRFVKAAAATPNRRTLHVLFGNVTLDYWSFMHARHFEHHFEQFGI
ncbi:MAG: DUF1569 domain-containing protein [Candidatus Hydrogenedentes bacterium]|nr:DUF1569 domain-containing protein [Candidatus Hydrogenedentota bacterium]